MDGVRVILKAVNELDFKLAFKTVNAELQKSPESDVYLSLKLYIYHNSHNRPAALQTAEQAVKVCSKKTLEMFLIPALVDYQDKDLLSTAFQRVNRLDPQDLEIREAWLESSLLIGDLTSAQKALMSMQRDSKDQRLNSFQCCLVMALEKPNKLFPMLAARMMDAVLPVRTPQECYVAALVRKMQNLESMVAYLQEAEVAEFLCGSLELQLLLLNGLLELEAWEQLYEYSKRQLQRIDSYNYWEALNSVAVHLAKEEEVIQFNSGFSGLNATLSCIDLAHKMNKDTKAAVTKFWAGFKDKPSTSDYLKPYIKNATDLENLDHTTLGSKINFAKLKAHIGEPLTVPELKKIYTDHLHEAPTEKTDYFIGSDALMMAVQQILDKNEGLPRYHAILWLEYGLKADPYNFYIKLALVEVYRSLGNFKLALAHFESLSIKNIQYETLSHMLTLRVGSVSPQNTLGFLNKLNSAHNKIPNFGVYCMAALRGAAFTQFSGMFELGIKLNNSLGYVLSQLESFKATRCLRGSINIDGLLSIAEPENLQDNRDFTTRFVHLDQFIGPIPKNEYVTVQRTKELAVCFKARDGKLTSEMEPQVAELSARADECSEFTEIERWNVRAVQAMLGQGELPPTVEPFNVELSLDWKYYHWAYTLLETLKVSKVLKATPPPGLKELVADTTRQYQSKLASAEKWLMEYAHANDIRGDVSKHTRAILNECHDRLKELLEVAS